MNLYFKYHFAKKITVDSSIVLHCMQNNNNIIRLKYWMDGSKRLPKNIEVDEPVMCFLCKPQLATMSEYQAFVSCSKVSPD